MPTVTPVNPDSLGYPGKFSRPKPVDPATTELWRSLGIHVPPSVLRESRENHERSLQGVLTAIALKLDNLTVATAENAEMMKGQYCRKDYVETELLKMRRDLTQQESKVIANARSAALSSISAMNNRLDAEKHKLARVIAQQEIMVKELREVQHELAEEDAAEELIGNADTDVLSMKDDATKMAALFESVAESAHAAEEKMQAMLREQADRDNEFNDLKSSIHREAADAQALAMRQSRNAADREAKLQAEMMKMANEMGKGTAVSKEMEQQMAAQAAALAASDRESAEKMAALQAKLAEEQARLEQARASVDDEQPDFMQQLEEDRRRQEEERRRQEEERRRELAAIEEKMRGEAEELKRERAAADKAAEELRQRMDAEFEAKLAAVESGGHSAAGAAEAKAELMMQKLEQERILMQERAESHKESQKAAAEAARLQMEQQVEMLEAQMAEAAQMSGAEAATDDDAGPRVSTELNSLQAELKAERDRMAAVQEAAEQRERKAEESAAREFEKLQEKLKSTSGADAAQVKAEMDKLRADEQARIQEASRRQEEEREQMMVEMKKMQEALFAEREKAALDAAKMKAEVEAAARDQMDSQLAAVKAGMDEQLSTQLSAQQQAEKTRQALEAEAARAQMEQIQAEIAEEKRRREGEIETEKQKLMAFQQDMKASLANAVVVPPEQQLMDLIIEKKASPKLIELVAEKKVVNKIVEKKMIDMIAAKDPSKDRAELSAMSRDELNLVAQDAGLADEVAEMVQSATVDLSQLNLKQLKKQAKDLGMETEVEELVQSNASSLTKLDLSELKQLAADSGVDKEDVAVAVKSASAELSKLQLHKMSLADLSKAAEDLGVDKASLVRANPSQTSAAIPQTTRPHTPNEITKKGKSRVQRKLDEKVLIEELRGRVGALTLKMSRLTKLLNGMDGADDFIPFVNQRLKELHEGKADRTDLTDLEQKLMDMGVGGGESMGNALKSMETTIDDIAARLADLIANQVDMTHVTGEAEKVEGKLQQEIDKLAAELVRIYRTTEERIDDVDEVKAEKDWIEDMLAKVRRQVGALKKQIGEGGGADGAAMGMLAGSLNAMMVKGEHPPNWPPSISHDASGMTQKRASGAGQQLVYRGGFPMTNSTMPIPTRTSMDMSSGVTRETMAHGQLTRAAASELLPRLMSEADFNATMGSLAGGSGQSATLTSDLVDRFRKSIWPPPSVPAFGSWPSPGDVLARAESLGQTQREREGGFGASGGGGDYLSSSGPLSPLREDSRAGLRSPTRTPSRLQMQRGARTKGGGVKMTPPSARRQVEPEPEYQTLQVRTGRASAPPSVV